MSGYVYIGGYQPAPGVLFIKGGKSSKPELRAKQYGTMLPGGLSFMRAAKVGDATKAERDLLAAIKAIDGVKSVGGEWFQCEPLMRLTVLDELYRLGPVKQVHTHCPVPFDEPKRWANRRRCA